MIAQAHLIPLTTAVQASTPGKGALAEGIYRECLNLFLNAPSQTPSSVLTKQRETTPAGAVTAIVTDNTTGLFVQLSGVVADGKVVQGPYLTYGKKFLEESKNAQLSNNAIRLWR